MYCVYLDVFGGWRWEWFGTDGEVVDSRECFITKDECIDDARRAGRARRRLRVRSDARLQRLATVAVKAEARPLHALATAP